MTVWDRRCRIFQTRPVRAELVGELNSSQAKIEGFELATYQAAHVALIGGGGIGSPVAIALARKGAGRLTVVDDDRVELKNLTRQHFARRDVGKFKAVCLAQRLARDGLFPATLEACPRRFQELLDRGHQFPSGTILICGVDNNPSRRAVAAYALARRMVAIHAAVGRDGNALYIMVQEPGKACWGCAFPDYLNDISYPCNLPGIIDVLQVVSGLIVYAVDTVLCARPREWNVRHIYLDGAAPDRVRSIPRRPGCALCTGYNLWAA